MSCGFLDRCFPFMTCNKRQLGMEYSRMTHSGVIEYGGCKNPYGSSSRRRCDPSVGPPSKLGRAHIVERVSASETSFLPAAL
jgi:hypothetical protein